MKPSEPIPAAIPPGQLQAISLPGQKDHASSAVPFLPLDLPSLSGLLGRKKILGR